MRIGIFTDAYTPYISGVVTSEVMLKKALEKKGHQVYVVTVNLESFKYEYDEKTRVYKIPGIPVGINELRQSGVYPIRAINKIKKWNLDVIHTQTEFAIGTFARVLGKQLDIPVVHTYHTMYEDYIHYITKGYFNYTSKKIVEYLTLFYCDKTISELIVPTKKAYDLFKEKYKVTRNIHIVPTGIEIDRFFKEKYTKDQILKFKHKLNFDKDDFIILFVGRLAQEKNVKFLIENHKDIIKKYKKAKLLIVGDGPDADNYKKLSLKYGLSDNIIFTGKVPWEDIPNYYQIANIFVTASTTETQGLTVIEAMAASTPPVAIYDESFKNVIIDDLNGKLFKNKKEYKNIILKLIDDSSYLKSLSHQARISANQYSSKYYSERVLDVYKVAIQNYRTNLGILNIFNRKKECCNNEEDVDS